MTKEEWEKENGYIYGHNGRYCDSPEYLGRLVEYYRENVHETTVEVDKVEAEDENSIFVRGIWQPKSNIIGIWNKLKLLIHGWMMIIVKKVLWKVNRKRLSVYSVFFSLGLSAVATFYFADIGLYIQSILL